MISQFIEPSSLKQHHNDFTNVSTQNHSEHSSHSSLSEKSTPKDPQNAEPIEEDSSNQCECQNIEESLKNNQKKYKQRYFKKSVEWLGRRYKRFKVKTQTLYLAISYLIKFIGLNSDIKYNYELLSSVCILLASKINEIHFPSIKSIIGAMDSKVSKQQILQAEQQILEQFGFDVVSQRNSYSIVYENFVEESEQKRKNAEKLLFLSISNPQTLQFGETYLGHSIVYLLKPQAMKQTTSINRDKMKKIAFIVYNMYKEKKSQLANKQNCSC